MYGSKKKKAGVKIPGTEGEGSAIPGCFQERDLGNITDLADGPIYLRTYDRLRSIEAALFILSNRLNASQRADAQACQVPYVAQTLRPGECGRVFQVIHREIEGIGSPVCEPEPEPDGDDLSPEPDGDGVGPEPDGGGVSPPEPDGGGVSPPEPDGGGVSPPEPDGGGGSPEPDGGGVSPPEPDGGGVSPGPDGGGVSPGPDGGGVSPGPGWRRCKSWAGWRRF